MLPETFPEDVTVTRLELSADEDDIVLNLSPVQQYLVFAVANRDNPDAVDATLPE